mmetsp:Transcript_25415/g.59143  ORF Transcript_25415/g.59143 Transcript_25415/m.59143 type:complete len:507 (+) Transcript_25415:83-1603(+)|eukprot:CAMPEP_0178404028 /NCGR_PEP_ID=MMETSP0689_2-20121128/17670_1 /TAXON_ID=160604 /ORGANISM="Amphidinium massartii, Strain CS-259" /LENGTH=506 /DNA_ID=CAMNT_0020024995 /DNA_START=67 /DNA_END=1587 /DNA_ORIENTATION=-
MATAAADADADGEPKTVGDEVRVLFNMFDKDRNGAVSKLELRKVLQALDPELWNNDAVDILLTGSDRNKDGSLQFTEFWSWICGHGGSTKEEDECRKVLLNNAVEHDRQRRAIAQKQMEKDEARRKEQERVEAERVKKEAEREAGVRHNRPEFVKARVSIGMSDKLADELFTRGDIDADGDIDKQEMSWLNGEFIQTTKQIRGLYTSDWDLDDTANELIMKEVIGVFDAWDKNGDGTINAEELCQIVQVLNPKLGQKTVEILLKEADKNADGVVDVQEFVSWLWGVNPKKKKDKEEQEARIAMALHRRRANEARDRHLQKDFEETQHKALEAWCTKRKIALVCGALNTGPGAPSVCKECGGRHSWLCHNCGFVSFYPECVNGCSQIAPGWTCVAGKCPRTKCGCKKKADYWQRYGFCHELDAVSADVDSILKGGKAEVDAKAKSPEDADAAGEEEEGSKEEAKTEEGDAGEAKPKDDAAEAKPTADVAEAKPAEEAEAKPEEPPPT